MHAAEEMTLSSPIVTPPTGATESPAQDIPAVTTSGKIKKRVILEQGQTLRLLALDLFGSREFWVYIYLENKNNIQNPNVVPLGTELIIPDPSYYHINASDPQSVSKAKTTGEELLRMWQ